VALGYISMTQPQLSRGPHEHLYQTDVFAFVGPGDFDMYLWDNRSESPTYKKKMKIRVGESEPTVVVVPPRVVHAYRCVSEKIGMVINLPDKLYQGVGRKKEVDEIRHEENKESNFKLD
jgi:dTDP-4-dehydrorhamnose 3,5-epimerase